METQNAIAFFATLAQIAATFAGFSIAALAFMVDRMEKRTGTRRKLYRQLTMRLIFSIISFAACSIFALLAVARIGDSYYGWYVWWTLFSGILAINIILFSFRQFTSNLYESNCGEKESSSG